MLGVQTEWCDAPNRKFAILHYIAAKAPRTDTTLVVCREGGESRKQQPLYSSVSTAQRA